MILKSTSSFKLLLIGLLVFSNLFLNAQKGGTTFFNDSSKVKIPKSIPVLDVIKEIQIASEQIKDFQTKIKTKNAIVKIDSAFPKQKALIASMKKESETFIKANPNKQKINNLLNNWQRFNNYLNVWQVTINDNIQRNARILEEATFSEKTWKLTLDSSKQQKVPNEIISSINTVWKDYSNITRVLAKENNNFLSLESKINNQRLITTNIIDQLEALKTSKTYNVFHRRHEPLWKVPITKTNVVFPESDRQGVLKLKNTVEFFKTFEHLIYLYIVIVLIIIRFIRYVKKGVVLFKYDEEDLFLKKSLDLIYNKSAILIAFICLIIAKFYFANAPKLFNDFLTLFIIILTAPIVYSSLTERFKNIVYLIIFFFIYDAAKTYIWFDSYQYRPYLLIEALLVIGCVHYFTKPYKKTRLLPLKPLGLFFVRLTPVIYGLAVIAIVSNILGYTNLADVSLKICTQGSAITIIFYAILKLLEGASLALIHRHFGPKATVDKIKKSDIEKKILKFVQIIVFILWFLFFLNILDQFNAVTTFFNDFLTEPYIIGVITFTIGDILSFFLILTGSFLVTSFISFIIDDDQGALKFLKLPKGIPNAISIVLRYLILAFGVVFALSSLGIDLGKFNLMAGALGLGIGFGLQNIISNFVSGLILVFERPILPGDTIEVNNLLGNVNKIGVRSSSISTFDGADVVVPNNNLISNDLINWTLSNNIKRMEILIGTTYDSDPNQVLEILLNCAKDYKEVMLNPGPVALFSDFGDSSLNFRLRFWVHFEIGLQAKSDISIAIYNKFKENGIKIPFPQQDVYIKNLPEKENT